MNGQTAGKDQDAFFPMDKINALGSKYQRWNAPKLSNSLAKRPVALGTQRSID